MSEFAVQVKNVDFSYQEDEPVLNNVSFNIKKAYFIGLFLQVGLN